MPSFAFFVLWASSIRPYKNKCTDEIIDKKDLPLFGFLECVGQFDTVNKFSKNYRFNLLNICAFNHSQDKFLGVGFML